MEYVYESDFRFHFRTLTAGHPSCWSVIFGDHFDSQLRRRSCQRQYAMNLHPFANWFPACLPFAINPAFAYAPFPHHSLVLIGQRGSWIPVAGSVQACHWSFDVGCWQGQDNKGLTRHDHGSSQPRVKDFTRHICVVRASFFADLPSHPVILGGNKSAALEPCEALLFLFWIGGENGLFQSHPVSFLCDFVRLQDSGSMFDQFKQKVSQNLFEK